MRKRGAGNHSGSEDSVTRSRALTELKTALEGVEFPTTREDLREWGRDVTAITGPNGMRWTVADLLQDAPIAEFSSPAHVAEVVRMRWEDMSDLFRPGGHVAEGAYGPADEQVVEPDETERALKAHDDAVGKNKDPHTGPGDPHPGT